MDKKTFFELIARLGIDLTLLVLQKFGTVTTVEEAIATLENIKTAQEYVDEDAKRRGVPAIPLPPP